MAKKEKQPYHIVTFTFPEESISYQAFSKLKKYHAEGLVGFEQLVVIKRRLLIRGRRPTDADEQVDERRLDRDGRRDSRWAVRNPVRDAHGGTHRRNERLETRPEHSRDVQADGGEYRARTDRGDGDWGGVRSLGARWTGG